MPRLTLYSRQGCHLCEDMERHLRELSNQLPFDLEVIDIDRDPVLLEKYNTLVPVLMAGNRILCNYFLDLKGLSDYLNSAEAV